MDTLTINKIEGHESEIEELKRLAKATKSIRMYKMYSAILKHFQGFTNRKVVEIENLEEHTVSVYIKNWTIELIRQWVIKQFNIIMCYRGMAEVLYGLNLSYTRPTYVMAKADKNKQEKLKNDFEELKNALMA